MKASETLIQKILNTSVENAKTHWTGHIHVAEEDGVQFFKTMILDNRRLNVRVEKGLIVEVLGIG